MAKASTRPEIAEEQSAPPEETEDTTVDLLQEEKQEPEIAEEQSAPPAPTIGPVKVIAANGLNLRKKADAASKILKTFAFGEILLPSEDCGDYLHVEGGYVLKKWTLPEV